MKLMLNLMKPLMEPQLTKEINSHERKDYVNEFNKEYLEEHHDTYLKRLMATG